MRPGLQVGATCAMFLDVRVNTIVPNPRWCSGATHSLPCVFTLPPPPTHVTMLKQSSCHLPQSAAESICIHTTLSICDRAAQLHLPPGLAVTSPLMNTPPK